MPRRTHRLTPHALALAAVVAGVALAACQDYHFSPVRYCLIQPGTERVTLSDISTADILFVVDDSGSMGLKQRKLADSFQAFIASLKASNVGRVASRLEPIDFHIAVTTTSVFLNSQTTASCATGCDTYGAQAVCCDSTTKKALTTPKACTTAGANPTECPTSGQCRADCNGRAGELTCCASAGASPERVPVTCATVGDACGRLTDRYAVTRAPRTCGTVGGVTTSCAAGPNPEDPRPAPAGFACRTSCQGLGGINACCDGNGVTWTDPTCDIGVGTEGGLYPRGDFVAKAGNARVLHFTKDLFCTRTADGTACACTGPGAPTTCDPPVVNNAAIDALSTQFKDNVKVGTCGSGQEQGLEAARRAIQKALAGTQPAEVGGGVPEWPHPRAVVAAGEKAASKLVVVFVGDEDDCSSPESATGGIIMTNSGTDACILDGTLPTDQQRRTRIQAYADFLTSLGRPVAGAFIVSASGSPCLQGSAECLAMCGAALCPSNCVDGSCAAALCTSSPATDPECRPDPTGMLTCGGVAPGARFVDLFTLLPGKGADAVLGSVCQPGEIANTPIASPPTFQKKGFSSILERVAEVVKQPAGLQLPTQPAAAELTLLRIAGADGKTRKTCRGPALAGTTVAEAEAAGYDWWFTGGDDTDRTPSGPSKFIYINRTSHSCEANPGETYSADYLGLVPAAGCQTSADCQGALGGALEDWTCDLTQGGARGTCLCGSGP
jgi:hypothetical protein